MSNVRLKVVGNKNGRVIVSVEEPYISADQVGQMVVFRTYKDLTLMDDEGDPVADSVIGVPVTEMVYYTLETVEQVEDATEIDSGSVRQ